MILARVESSTGKTTPEGEQTMKVKASVKRICESCRIIKRCDRQASSAAVVCGASALPQLRIECFKFTALVSC